MVRSSSAEPVVALATSAFYNYLVLILADISDKRRSTVPIYSAIDAVPQSFAKKRGVAQRDSRSFLKNGISFATLCTFAWLSGINHYSI